MEDGHPYTCLPPDGGREEGRVNEAKPISCNSCGAEMKIDVAAHSATCTRCSQHVNENGQVILPRLYPSTIHDPEMYREFVDYQLSEWHFFDQLKFVWGMIDEAEFEQCRLRAEEVKQKMLDDMLR